MVTGASSGFGLAIAHAFAREGARLVLAARSEAPLAEAAERCRRSGAEVVHRATDVSDEGAVERLAAEACERFGRIDVWVNNAGLIAYGSFSETPPEAFRRVVETTFLGQVHGSRAALTRFRAQGEGVLINMCSVWGRVTAPQVAPYVASKFAVRAFSECLRQELRDEPRIDVATILPQAADTPIFEHAASYTGRTPRPIPPLVTAEEVAEGVIKCARDPKREVTFNRAGRAVEVLNLLAPSLYARLLPPFFELATFAGRDRRPRSDGNLFDATAPYGVMTGGWDGLRRLPRRAATAGVGAALVSLIARGWRRRRGCPVSPA